MKLLAAGQDEPVKFVSGPTLTPARMVAGVKKLGRGWKYHAISMGYPGLVLHGRVVAEPHNLGRGWVPFDYRAAFGRPVKIINDAAMQALGSYKGGKMLFLGLGTGLGSALVVDGIVEPMELGHLPYRKGTYEAYVGQRGLEQRGKKKWRRHVAEVVAGLIAALEPRRRGARGWERQEAQGPAGRVPGRRQRQRLRRRDSLVGRSGRVQDPRPAETGPQR